MGLGPLTALPVTLDFRLSGWKSASVRRQDIKASWGLQEGDEIAPGRSVLDRMGGGRFYEVYLAWDDRLLSTVVAKLLRPDHAQDDGALRRLAREADLLARLAHPVIVRGFGSVSDGEFPHLVLEHLEGPTLKSLIAKYGLSLDQLLPLAMQMCSGLHYLSEEKVVHLDVKPGNVIMESTPRLIDLSIARSFADARKMTVARGTDAYMAPEQCQPQAGVEVGPAADMWGLGVTLYEAATAHRPFPPGGGREEPDLLRRYPQMTNDPEPMSPKFPVELRDVIMACLDKDPAARPTASESRSEIESMFVSVRRGPLRRRRPKLS